MKGVLGMQRTLIMSMCARSPLFRLPRGSRSVITLLRTPLDHILLHDDLGALQANVVFDWSSGTGCWAHGPSNFGAPLPLLFSPLPHPPPKKKNPGPSSYLVQV